MPNSNDPLDPNEGEKLLRILELLAEKMKRLLTQGCAIDEACDDSRILASQKKLRQLRDEMARESDRLQTIKATIRRRKCSGSSKKH